MYPWYQGLKPNFELPQDDRLGIQNMYGSKEKRMWERIPPNLPTEPPHVYTTERTHHRPEQPRYPVHYPDRHPDPGYPRHRPTQGPRPRFPERTPENRPEYPGSRPDYPERRPNNPERRPEYIPPRFNPEIKPNYPITPRSPERQPEENPDRRTHKYYPVPKPNYPGTKPLYPHHPHSTLRPHFPPTTENPYYPGKPEHPRKPHSPKKTYYPEKPWRPDRNPERRPPTEVTLTGETKPPKPDSCNTNYDAVALIRGEVFIFKSQYLWRIGDMGVFEGFPTFINRMWSGLPESLTHVDAVYERPDRKIVFFIGKEFYVFNANRLEPGYPRPLTDLGLPHTLEHLNAAMIWGHNGKTYFYNETMYWRFDDEKGRVELDYPRDMSMWKGVGNNIDTVFQWKDGKTYFFKGKGFWKFNDLHMRVENEKQQLSGPFWMGCPYPGDDNYNSGHKQPYQGLPPSPTSTFDTSKGNSVSYSLFLILTITIFFILDVDLT